MITALREKISGWIAGVIIGLITIPFALWGVSNYFTANIENYVAKVDGLEIPLPEFQSRFARYKERMSSMFGDNFDATYFDQPQIKRQFLDSLIREKVIDLNLADAGYEIPPQDLRDAIAGMEVFQTGGQFDKTLYRAVLRQQFRSPEEFQALMRGDMLRSQLPNAITTSSFATGSELAEIVRLRDQKRNFSYILIESGRFMEGLEIAEEDVVASYESSLDAYMNPETVTVSYLELDGSSLGEGVDVEESQLRDMYDEQIKRFTTDAERRISHILIQVDENADADAVTAALIKAQDIKARLDAGADFAEIAGNESDDKGSSALGGDLGALEAEFMEPVFVEAAESLEVVGAISDPVKSPFGFHLIKLTSHVPEAVKTFEDVRVELETEFRENVADREFLDLAEQLGNLTYEDQNSLAPAAEALSLEIKSFGPFGRTGGTGLAANPEIVKSAFSNAVLENDENSEPVNLGDNHIVVLRISEHTAAAPQPLDEVRALIENQLKRETASVLVSEHVQSLHEMAQGGKSLEDIALSDSLEPSKVSDALRTESSADRNVLAEAFKLPSNSAMDQVSLVELPTGGMALIRLEGVTDGSWSDIDEAARDSLSNQIKSAIGNNEMEAVIASWENKAEIEIREDLL